MTVFAIEDLENSPDFMTDIETLPMSLVANRMCDSDCTVVAPLAIPYHMSMGSSLRWSKSGRCGLQRASP